MSRTLAVHTEAIDWGGAEACLALVLGGLGEEFDRVVVVGPGTDVLDRLVAASGPSADAVLIPSRRNPLDPRPLPATMKALRGARADALHINAAFTWGNPYALAAAPFLRSTRIVFHEHLPLAANHASLRALKRAAVKRAAAVVAVSDRAAREVEQHIGLPAQHVRTIPNGVPAPDDAPPVREHDAPTVVATGRLTDQKGFDVLVRALAQLPGAHAVVVGEGPEREALTRLAAELGVADRFHLAGFQPDARRWVRGADVAVVPSRWEAMPLAILEALAEGTPLVAADVGAAAEVLEGGHAGAIVPPDDPDALAAALGSLLGDRASAQALGAAGHDRWQRHHTTELMQQRWAALYRELLGD
ncbi:MAG TPA: glycosyltransferase [Mycobacteriales bacterium]|nr:glycosyltransferase [Mycobacteriales bacterium]